MAKQRDIWLVANEGSGSVREELLEALHDTCASSDLCIAHRADFPGDPIPTAQQLDRAGVATLVTLGGDGTINAVVSALAGWGGAILPLPGGTQNLLTHRLHGDARVEDVIKAFADGKANKVRPRIIRSSQGIALAGLMVGPGTSWNDVREAMRAGDPAQMLRATGAAIEGTTGRPPVRIAVPPEGQREGYPIIELVPHANGMDAAAYHARTGADFVAQTWALMRQEFREGPHDTLGPFDRLEVESTGGEPLDLLLDGDPADATPRETFSLEQCPVDLIATMPGGG